MLTYAIVFFVLGVVTAVLGFGGMATGALTIAKVLFFVFLILFLGSLVWGLVHRNL